ncbi:Senescence regulator [Parasponia andersonii]|uniref:Senescence regulator n=1 Tax=Parasponia andersonii TaxID=3476 RepID=A0A2P5DU18_PARAD|nr:Senescence regulator [Parasponia andersonii]
MATSKSYFTRQNYRFLSGDQDYHTAVVAADSSAFELDESDLYNSARSNSPEFRKPVSTSRLISKKPSSKRSVADPGDRVGATPASLPVNIPDWSKILRDEYRDSRSRGNDDDDDDFDGHGDCDGGGSVRVPPHEFLARQMARTRIASFSVHEGIGRTLKGRDLSRVRNAIWEKTGFQD